MRTLIPALLMAVALVPACRSSRMAETNTTTPAAVAAAQPTLPPAADATDPYLWLEDVQGDRALAWVRERNQRSLGTLQADPRYQRFYNEALKIVEARDRIAFPTLRGRDIENFWQDSAHIRGLWRRTTLDSY
jgi:prolyl oligopeptidase